MSVIYILVTVWRARIDSFLQIYLLITGIAAIGVAYVVGTGTAPRIEEDGKSAAPAARHPYSPTAILALIPLVLILAGYVAVLKWEAFADYDESYFTLYTLKGHSFAPPIWPSMGRFFPLGQQEFNLARHFTSSVVGYHAVAIGQLLIMSCLLLFLDAALPFTWRVGLTAACVLTPSIVTAFTALLFPERNVAFWLVCLLFFVIIFEKTVYRIQGPNSCLYPLVARPIKFWSTDGIGPIPSFKVERSPS